MLQMLLTRGWILQTASRQEKNAKFRPPRSRGCLNSNSLKGFNQCRWVQEKDYEWNIDAFIFLSFGGLSVSSVISFSHFLKSVMKDWVTFRPVMGLTVMGECRGSDDWWGWAEQMKTLSPSSSSSAAASSERGKTWMPRRWNECHLHLGSCLSNQEEKEKAKKWGSVATIRSSFVHFRLHNLSWPAA